MEITTTIDDAVKEEKEDEREREEKKSQPSILTSNEIISHRENSSIKIYFFCQSKKKFCFSTDKNSHSMYKLNF